jgi:hypothetical protein
MRIEIDDTGSKKHFCRDWIATPREATLSSGLPASLDISHHSDHIPDTIASANPDGSPDDFCGDCEIKIFLSETGDEVDGDIVECYCGCGFGECAPSEYRNRAPLLDHHVVLDRTTAHQNAN